MEQWRWKTRKADTGTALKLTGKTGTWYERGKRMEEDFFFIGTVYMKHWSLSGCCGWADIPNCQANETGESTKASCACVRLFLTFN